MARLSYLKLDGFPAGSAVYFCPECDFQYVFARPAPRAYVGCNPIRHICPWHGTLQLILVTPDLIEHSRAAA